MDQQGVNQKGVNSELHKKILEYVYNNNGFIHGSYVYKYLLKNQKFNDVDIALPKSHIKRKIINNKIVESKINQFMEENKCKELTNTYNGGTKYSCPNGLVYDISPKEKIKEYINTDKADIVYDYYGFYHKRYPKDKKALMEAMNNYMTDNMCLYEGDYEYKAETINSQLYHQINYPRYRNVKCYFQELKRKWRNN